MTSIENNKANKLLTAADSFNHATDNINKVFELDLSTANYMFNLHKNHELYNRDVKAATDKHYKMYIKAIKAFSKANKK